MNEDIEDLENQISVLNTEIEELEKQLDTNIKTYTVNDYYFLTINNTSGTSQQTGLYRIDFSSNTLILIDEEVVEIFDYLVMNNQYFAFKSSASSDSYIFVNLSDNSTFSKKLQYENENVKLFGNEPVFGSDKLMIYNANLDTIETLENCKIGSSSTFNCTDYQTYLVINYSGRSGLSNLSWKLTYYYETGVYVVE